MWNTPALTRATTLHSPEYGFLQLTIVVFIAVAGVTGIVKMSPWLQRWSSNRKASLRVLFASISVKLLLDSQVCWVLRPFPWDPAGPEVLIGRKYFRGSFFETLFVAAC